MKMINKTTRESNEVVNAGIGYTIGNIFIKGISFLTIPLYTRLMTTGDYGIYNTYVAYVGMATFLVCLGLDPTLKNAEQEFPERRQTYLSTIYILTLEATALFLVVLFVYGDWLSRFLGLTKGTLFLLVLNAEATAVVNIYNIKLSLSYSSKSYLKIAFFQTFLGIGLSVTLMLTLFEKNRYLGRIVGTMIPAVCVAVLILWNSIAKMNLSDRFNKAMAAYSLRLGLPLIPHLLAQIINAQFDRIMISRMVGYNQSGIYSFTYNIAVILQIVYQSLDNVWSPWFFQRMAKAEYERIKNSSKKYTALIAFLTVSLMTISKEFIKIFSTQAYWEGRTIALTLIEGIFFLFLYTLPVGVEYYTKNTKYIAFGSMLTAILNVVLNYFGIKYYGYEAAADTTLISYIVLLVIHWVIANRIFSLERIFDLKWLMALVAAVIVWGTFCRSTQDIWLVRYGAYAVIFVIVADYFKEDVLTYIRNIKK